MGHVFYFLLVYLRNSSLYNYIAERTTDLNLQEEE